MTRIDVNLFSGVLHVPQDWETQNVFTGTKINNQEEEEEEFDTWNVHMQILNQTNEPQKSHTIYPRKYTIT